MHSIDLILTLSRLAFAEAILRRLGAAPEQIDRERSRAHAELFGESAA